MASRYIVVGNVAVVTELVNAIPLITVDITVRAHVHFLTVFRVVADHVLVVRIEVDARFMMIQQVG
jgi:hypothetical protein